MNNHLDIEQIREHALIKGGKCLSDYYENGKKKLLWQCRKGHRWESSTQSVIGAGSWCPACAKNIRLTIEEMQAIAEERGGECLSKKYINSETKLIWKCEHGHQWESTPLSVKYRESWCPYCAKNRAYTIKDMQSLAKDNGGICLSKNYVNVKTKLIWKCENNHVWESTPDNIKKGRWCPHCNKIKKGIEKDSNNFKKMSQLAHMNILTDSSNHM
jgi:hypothetical protein